MPFITRTRCMPGWPLAYRTYHQEIQPPYRRCDHALVLRLGRLGVVVGRWDGRAADLHQALADAIGARPTAALDDDGCLLPNFYRETSETDVP